MQQHILHRLLLAKIFLRDARTAVQTSRNDLALSRSVVYLHDAADNVLGAVAAHRGVKSGARDAMMDTFSALEKHGMTLTGRAEMSQLSAMRNAIKHQGVPQNSGAVVALLPAVSSFIDSVLHDTFGIALEQVTLAQMIENATTRAALENVEKLITNGEFKAAIEALGVVRFNALYRGKLEFTATFRKLMSDSPLPQQKHVFPEDDAKAKRLDCLELGVDPDELTRFEWLIPRVGFDNMEDRNLIFVRNGTFWHERNWTLENSTFCLNFLVHYLAAKQKTPDAPSVTRRWSKTNVLTFVRDGVLTTYAGEVLQHFNAGDTLTVSTSDLVEGVWQNYGEDRARVNIPGDELIFGYIQKEDMLAGPDEDELFR